MIFTISWPMSSSKNRYKPPRIPLPIAASGSLPRLRLNDSSPNLQPPNLHPMSYPHDDISSANSINASSSLVSIPLISSDCMACLETLPLTSFPTESITPGCTGETEQICTGCLQDYLTSQLDRVIGQGAIPCPLCPQLMSDNDMHRWASPETLNRYLELKVRAALSEEPEFIWCSNAQCGSGQIHSDRDVHPIMTCNECHARTCFNHQRPWHEGMTCYQFDHPEEDDEADIQDGNQVEAQQEVRGDGPATFDAMAARDSVLRHGMHSTSQSSWLRQMWNRMVWTLLNGREKQEQTTPAKKEDGWTREIQKRLERRAELRRLREEERLGEQMVLGSSKVCPGQGCSYRVLRDGGCKHMTCTRCTHEWCWTCHQPWERGHLGVECGPVAPSQATVTPFDDPFLAPFRRFE